MSSKSIFTQTHAPRTNRFVDGFDSAVYSNLAIGKVQGQCRTLNALMSTLATDDDVWRIVNLQSKKDGMNAYDAIAVLGAGSNEQATDWALQQFGQFFDAMVTTVSETSHQGLMRHLANPQYHAYQSPIRANELAAMQDMVTGQQVQWDGVDLKSHGGQTGTMLVDMIKHDDHHLLLDAMDRNDLNDLLASIGAEHASYDALIVAKHQLDRLMTRLSTAMAKASAAGVSITNVTQTEPFKKNKVTQIAVLFEMNDGQSVAIVFHNPDSTPSKLLPQDTLISWKWLLNNRDVSAAIQPNQGDDVQLPVLATRIMKLVNQNSARFKRQQAAKAKTQQGLDDARKRLGEQSELIAALDGEMAEIQKRIDEPVSNPMEQTPAASDPEYTPEQLLTPEELAQAQLEPPPVSNPDINDLADQTTSLINALAYPLAEKFISTNIRIPKSLVTGDDSSHFIENGQTVFKEFRIRIIDEGNGSYAFIQYQDAKKNWHQLKGNAVELSEFQEINDASLELWETVNSQKNEDPKNSAINPDQEFLHNIINGTVEATTVDMDYIIELAEKYQDDKDVNALVDQALEVINQAEQSAAQSVA